MTRTKQDARRSCGGSRKKATTKAQRRQQRLKNLYAHASRLSAPTASRPARPTQPRSTKSVFVAAATKASATRPPSRSSTSTYRVHPLPNTAATESTQAPRPAASEPAAPSVEADQASSPTDVEYAIWGIYDRDVINGVVSYLVRWHTREETWEPRTHLLNEGLTDAVNLVDDWKLSKTPSFLDFCRSKGIDIGDSDDGRCAFVALKLALASIQNSAWYSEAMVDTYLETCRRIGRPVSDCGVDWRAFGAFVKAGNTTARERGAKEIRLSALDKNLTKNSMRTPESVLSLGLDDGAYLCAALAGRRGHCVLLEEN
ncbi:hypothetical protein PINS_up016409 [Pythium insidiosum]|nr:hypothetical protein PINS_up016409 [Pythium insidiosum]